MAGLFTELKRRNVFRVGIFYAIVAWVLLQVADIVIPAMGIPEWGLRFIMLLLGLGLPIALIFAWAFEITPEGIKLEKDVDRSQSVSGHTGRNLDFIISGVLVLAVAGLVAERFLFGSGENQTPGATLATDNAGADNAADSAPVVRDRKSIAVIPFDNRSADEEDAEFFAEGMHDDILTLLSKIHDLKVISRTSVQKYKNTEKTIPEIGAELGVATVLEGGVQRAGNQVRINVQLIDVSNDEHLWAETYNRQLTAENIFEVQGEIASAVSSALEATLSTSEQNQLTAVLTENLEAYEAYTMARRKLRMRTSQELFDGADLFRKAFTLDPTFSQAYAGYAGALLLQESYTEVEYADIEDDINAAINTALRLDPNLAEAYAVKGLVSQYSKDLDQAEQYFQKAIELNPNYVRGYHWYGVILRVYLSRYEEALSMHMKALEMDPLSPIINFNVAVDLGALGRFDEARIILEREVELNPTGALAQIGVGWMRWLKDGAYQRAMNVFSEVMLRDTGLAGVVDSCALMLLDLGLDDEAVRISNRVPGERQAKSAIAMVRNFHNDVALTGIAHYEEVMSTPTTEWDETFQAKSMMLQILHASDAADDTARALALYRKYYPELFDDQNRRVVAGNAVAAQHVARLMRETGDSAAATGLLDDVEVHLRPRPVAGSHGKGFPSVSLLALQGRDDQAIEHLREILDSGYRAAWWINLKNNPNLDSIANDPRFQAMIGEIEADMAGKRAQIEASGFLASL